MKKKSAPKTSPAVLPERAATRPHHSHFPIVGIGASAGGLEAMNQLLRHLPGDTGMAFVLVQHLDPTHESALTALLARSTPMTVVEARNNHRLAPNHLYIIPPNKLMRVSGRKLQLAPRANGKEVHAAIDHFLQSLAAAEGSSAVSVILSGNGSDGTQGSLAIKAAGGIAIAQDAKTAKYPTMPGNAVNSGCVDFILPPDKIGAELARISGHPYILPHHATALDGGPLPDGKVFTEVLTLLRQRLCVDFTHYKQATLQRRIQRRMVLHKMEDLAEYVRFLKAHPAEAKELFNDILIHVTGFFRDPAVFQTLKKKIFPRIVKSKNSEDAIRMWVPGCSTGEEVYSLAMTLMEFLADKKIHLPLQIFGTDINENALEKARAGVYADGIHEAVATERLRRFFTKTDGGYRITKTIREMCIFARQNVVTDPPFSNLDLISCRNLLIYLGIPLQRKIFPLFHYALKPTGLLLLGASETIGGFVDLFAPVDAKAKAYSKKTSHVRPPVIFAPPLEMPKLNESDARAKAPEFTPNLTEVQKQADRILLTHYGPTGVVINRHLEVIQFRGATGLYLEHAQGEASLNLLKMAREGLVVDLRAVTAQAIKQNTRVRREHIRVRQNAGYADLTIEVAPFSVPPSRERYFLVLFEPEPKPATVAQEKKWLGAKARAREGSETAELARLRDDLAATRESLQAIIEEQEATNEELRSANEEIMSSNEELQSTNEELETAKEELQSTNEELTTLNEELETRNVEIETVNNDLHNLLASVNIPILILSTDLRIRRFTAVAEKIFNLIPTDVGRPVTDIALRVEVPNLAKLVTDVIDSPTTKEMEVRDKEGRWWSVRIRPYKTTDNKIDGAIVAMVDIDTMKASAELLHSSRDFAEAIVNTVRHPLIVLDEKLKVESVNDAFCRLFKVNREETLSHRIYDLGNGQWDIPRLRELLEDILPHNSQFKDFKVTHTFPGIGEHHMVLNARKLTAHDTRRELILLAIENIARPKNARQS